MGTSTVLFGVGIDDLTMDGCIELIDGLVVDGRASGRNHQIATVNVDFIVNALEEPDLKALLQNSSANLADGMPIVWSSRVLGRPLQARLAGSDLVPELAAQSADRGWRIHFFGGAGDVARRAAEVLIKAHPGAEITFDAGPIITDPTIVDPALADSINAFRPDILCVALGNPKQERFIEAYRDHLDAPVMIGVGGSFDMHTGDRRRAPRWLQRVGGEWVFRAAQEPRRLGPRYAHDLRVFVPSVHAYRRAELRHERGTPLQAAVEGRTVVISQSTSDLEHHEGWDRAREVMVKLERCHLDVAEVGAITPASHAQLVGLVRSARRHGVTMETTPWTTSFESALDDYGTKGWLFEVFADERRTSRDQEAPESPDASGGKVFLAEDALSAADQAGGKPGPVRRTGT